MLVEGILRCTSHSMYEFWSIGNDALIQKLAQEATTTRFAQAGASEKDNVVTPGNTNKRLGNRQSIQQSSGVNHISHT